MARRGVWWAVCLWALAGTLPAQSSKPATSGPLTDRQAVVRERVERLENRMLELARVLNDSEPEKAQRLREGLALAGRKQLKSRLATLVGLLREQQFGQADRAQQAVITDLEGLFEFLTSTADELERMRKEREKLDQLRRAVRRLMDEQLQNLYRTRQFNQAREIERAQPPEPAAPRPTPGASPEGSPQSPSGSPGDSPQEAMRSLEQMQRETQRRAGELDPQMEPSQDGRPAPPGAEDFKAARENMQQAADRLGEQDAEQGEAEQQAAAEKLQKALDELEKSLRQVREDEKEEALTQIEARLRKLLSQEQSVREMATGLASRPRPQWNRADELRLSEAGALHNQALEEAGQTHRILVDEGTTVVVPALLAQALDDMRVVADRLRTGDLASDALPALNDVIALLEEMLAAVARERDAMAEQPPAGAPPAGQQDQTQPLLPRSAELKLLRGMQVRVNERTTEAAAEEATDAVTALLQRLSARQDWLSERTRQMNEAP